MKKHLISFAMVLGALHSGVFAAAGEVVFAETMEKGTEQWVGQSGDGSVPLHGSFVADPLSPSRRVLRFDKPVFGGDFFSINQFSKAKYRVSFDYLGTCPSKNCGGVLGVTSDFSGRDQWLAGTSKGFPAKLKDDGKWQHYDLEFDANFDFHLALEQWSESTGVGGDIFFADIKLTALDDAGKKIVVATTTDYRRLTLQSSVLGKPMRVQVFVPQGYDAKKRYPVLYWLAGLNNTENDALYKAGLGTLANELVAQGKLQPMLIVAPEMDNSWATNTGDTWSEKVIGNDRLAEGKYDDYLTKELIPFIDAQFATDTRQSARWVGGISMGGYAAIALALRHPTLYSRVGGHSPAIIGTDRNDPLGRFLNGWLYPDDATRQARDPMLLVNSVNLDSMSFWLDSGEQDYQILKESKRFVDLLNKRHAKLQFSTASGGHDSFYWNEDRRKSYLMFYAGLAK
ncbi:MAG: alpha/beta hydrolase-fold protein [Proteobacteria bacterium]|nr:alpha/beta hydrolase-fold protein [Pseudomonadota bacterium]